MSGKYRSACVLLVGRVLVDTSWKYCIQEYMTQEPEVEGDYMGVRHEVSTSGC